MKYLFRSKIFRRNLYRWTISYVCVMLLFQTVTTYSKYISQMESSDEARVAKFHVDIQYDQCMQYVTESVCNENSKCNPVSVCNAGYYRPTSDIPYYFMVDTSELEVKSLFVLNVSVNADFQVVSFENLTDKKDWTKDFQGQEIKLTEEIGAGLGKKTFYKIVVHYKASSNEMYDMEKQYGQVVNVGYSAAQIKK